MKYIKRISIVFAVDYNFQPNSNNIVTKMNKIIDGYLDLHKIISQKKVKLISLNFIEIEISRQGKRN